MTIETKYSIGDEVWFMLGKEPIKSRITQIYIGASYIAYDITIKYSHGFAFEKELFTTKEELLKSL